MVRTMNARAQEKDQTRLGHEQQGSVAVGLLLDNRCQIDAHGLTEELEAEDAGDECTGHVLQQVGAKYLGKEHLAEEVQRHFGGLLPADGSEVFELLRLGLLVVLLLFRRGLSGGGAVALGRCDELVPVRDIRSHVGTKLRERGQGEHLSEIQALALGELQIGGELLGRGGSGVDLGLQQELNFGGIEVLGGVAALEVDLDTHKNKDKT